MENFETVDQYLNQYRRITLTVPVIVLDALIKLALNEERDPRGQAVIILRSELERRGLLERSRDA